MPSEEPVNRIAAARVTPLDAEETRFELDGQAYNIEHYYATLGEALDAMDKERNRLFVLLEHSGQEAPFITLIRRAKLVFDQNWSPIIFPRRSDIHGICDPPGVGPSLHHVRAIGLTDTYVSAYRDTPRIGDLTGRCVVIETQDSLIHGTLQGQLDPVIVSPPDHNLNGHQTVTTSINFIYVERVMLCPVAYEATNYLGG